MLAQAVLTREMPYQLLEYSQVDVAFPRDSTADQSFNSRQFDAYQQLGQFIGRAAARRGGRLEQLARHKPAAQHTAKAPTATDDPAHQGRPE